MKRGSAIWLPLVAAAGIAVFLLTVAIGKHRRVGPEPAAAVVMPAAAQVLFYAGDRYLAATVESVRASMSGGTLREDEAVFRLRAHRVASQLNPCHEDNYWIGNAELTWGGAHELGFDLLRRAMDCRFWDEWPAFFYGFNLQFFRRDVVAAGVALETAAQRADQKNAAAYRKFAVMLRAAEFEDARLALELVQRERDKATDPRLREMLNQRVTRLEGLVVLREARRQFEARFGRPLAEPGELLSSGVLAALPRDPLKLGYTFERGDFHLRTLKNEALESLR